jgi:hypothetical protein
MHRSLIHGRHWLGVTLLLTFATAAHATEIGQVKVARGHVVVERQGKTQPATVGARLQAADVVRTGTDGAVGITMDDDSLLSAGPNSELVLDRYAFDATTNQGRFDTSLNKGTLSVISGRIAKQAPDAMTVRTPNAILGARGTEFVVRANE